MHSRVCKAMILCATRVSSSRRKKRFYLDPASPMESSLR
jgi:hypothetical protein